MKGFYYEGFVKKIRTGVVSLLGYDRVCSAGRHGRNTRRPRGGLDNYEVRNENYGFCCCPDVHWDLRFDATRGFCWVMKRVMFWQSIKEWGSEPFNYSR